MNVIENNLSVLIYKIILLLIIFFLFINNVCADVGPLDTNSQNVEHKRSENHDYYSDDDKDKSSDVKLSKNKYTPKNLNATAIGEDRVKLNWEDNAKQEAGYYVERKKGGGIWRFLAKLGRSSENYNDLTVLPGTIYYYRVKAFNGEKETSWSNEAFTKTKGITMEEKMELEKKEALDIQKKELKMEFDVTLKKELEDVKIEILSQAVNTCDLSDVSTKKVDIAFKKRCEELTGMEININEPTKLESVKNEILYNTKYRLILAGILLFIIMNNVLWHMKHKTVKNKLKGEF